MEIFLVYVKVFFVGGILCMAGQVLINLTKLTSSRILLIFLLLGVFLEAIGVFEHLKEFANAGVTIPITGFGSNLAKGAIKGVKERGFFGAITGGVEASGMGLGIAIFVGFFTALLSKSHSKT